MSELTDQVVAEHIARHPTLWERRTQDPLLHAQLEWTRRFLSRLETVLRQEGVPADQGERVLRQAAGAAVNGWDDGFYGAGPVRPDEEPTP